MYYKHRAILETDGPIPVDTVLWGCIHQNVVVDSTTADTHTD